MRRWDGVEDARELARQGQEVWAYDRVDDRYLISNLGQVYSLNQTKRLRFKTVKSGYLRVHLGSKREGYVHALVLEAFDGAKPVGARAWRLSDDPMDNRLCNLTWRRGAGRLTDEAVEAVRTEFAAGTMTVAQAAALWGTSQGYAHDLLTGKVRTEAGGPQGVSDVVRGHLDAQVRMLAEGEDARELSKAGIEVWKPVPTLEHRYLTSNMGRVLFRPHWRLVKPDIWRSYGYSTIVLTPDDAKSFQIQLQRLLLRVFDGVPPLAFDRLGFAVAMDARHLNGDGSDNRLFNLAWGTRSENTMDAVEGGRAAMADTHGRTHLTSAGVERALDLFASGSLPDVEAVAAHLGTSTDAVMAILAGRTWRHVPRPASLAVQPLRAKRFTAAEKTAILDALRRGESASSIARRFGTTPQHIGYYRSKL